LRRAAASWNPAPLPDIGVAAGLAVAAQDQAFAATVLQTQVDAMSSDFSGVPFEVGQRYLVGAVNGTITSCGVTGADSGKLRAVYDAAFPG